MDHCRWADNKDSAAAFLANVLARRLGSRVPLDTRDLVWRHGWKMQCSQERDNLRVEV